MHPFDQDIAVVELKPFHFGAVVAAGWSINGVPNGGYLMAIAVNAMHRCAGKSATPIVTANFSARCTPGEAHLFVERVSSSPGFDRLQARFLQRGEEKFRAFGTFAADRSECPLERIESAATEVAPMETCVPMPALPGYTLFERADVRLDPGGAGWMTTGVLSGRSEQKGWFAFREQRGLDIPAVLLAADAFPPPVLASQGLVAWVPTLELSVNVRRVPASDRVRGVFRTRFITCGLLEEDGELWDEAGGLVAISRQIAQYRPA
jgi:hypothetical protein